MSVIQGLYHEATASGRAHWTAKHVRSLMCRIVETGYVSCCLTNCVELFRFVGAGVYADSNEATQRTLSSVPGLLPFVIPDQQACRAQVRRMVTIRRGLAGRERGRESVQGASIRHA